LKKEAAAKIEEAKKEAEKQAHPETEKETKASLKEKGVAAMTKPDDADKHKKAPATPAKKIPAKAAPAKKPVEAEKAPSATHEATVINHEDAKELHKIS
jgi:hypothetical protein